jgi:methylase of polypeptide subunit release factors
MIPRSIWLFASSPDGINRKRTSVCKWNMLTAEQQSALLHWGNLLSEARLDRWWQGEPDSEHAPIAEKFHVLLRLFGEGEDVDARDLLACVPSELLSIIEGLGLVSRIGETVTPAYQLVFNLGTWLFFEKLSPSAKFYYGNDTRELSRLVRGATGNVLDLGSGIGTHALVCARTAAHVTAVEIEPLAAKLFWINAAMNGMSHKLELFIGDLFEPVAGRTFDLICCNPPYMPVPSGMHYPQLANGGPDGLAIMRRLLAGVPQALNAGGRCAIYGSALGTCKGPDLLPFKQMAAESSLAMMMDCRTCNELDGIILKRFVGMATRTSENEDVEAAFRCHFASLKATHLYCFLLHVQRAPSPALCATYREGKSTSVCNVRFP